MIASGLLNFRRCCALRSEDKIARLPTSACVSRLSAVQLQVVQSLSESFVQQLVPIYGN